MTTMLVDFLERLDDRSRIIAEGRLELAKLGGFESVVLDTFDGR